MRHPVPPIVDPCTLREPTERNTQGPLRAGLVIGPRNPRTWQLDALKILEERATIKVVALIRNGSPPAPVSNCNPWVVAKAMVDWMRARAPDSSVAVRLLESVEGRVFSSLIPFVGRSAAEDRFEGAQLVQCSMPPESGQSVQLDRLGLDVLVNLSGNCDSAAIPACATLGMIEFAFEGRRDEDALAALLVGRVSQVKMEVRRFSGGVSETIGQSIAAVGGEPFLLKAEARAFSRAKALLVRAVQSLAGARQVPTFQPSSPTGQPTSGQSATLLDAATFEVKAIGLSGRYRLREMAMRQDHWFLAYRTNPELFVSNRGGFVANDLIVIEPPLGSFYADPCALEHKGSQYVFFEEYQYASRKGVVSYMRLQPDGTMTAPIVVLDRPYHLSYPFLFEWDGDVYMVPESAANRTVDLYRARRFPEDWEFVSTLLSGVNAVDATLHFHAGMWWMFSVIGDMDSATVDELYLFHATTPLGPWVPHAANPIKSDPSSARPAGRLFSSGGRLFRPAQDCSQSYGGSLALCEVKVWDKEQYAEEVVSRFSGGWRSNNSAFHTLTASSNLEVIDGRAVTPRRGFRLGSLVRLVGGEPHPPDGRRLD